MNKENDDIFKVSVCCICHKTIKRDIKHKKEFKPQICLTCFLYRTKWFRGFVYGIIILEFINLILSFFGNRSNSNRLLLILNIVVASLALIYLLTLFIAKILGEKKTMNLY